jgi:hypothetical protein
MALVGATMGAMLTFILPSYIFLNVSGEDTSKAVAKVSNFFTDFPREFSLKQQITKLCCFLSLGLICDRHLFILP